MEQEEQNINILMVEDHEVMAEGMKILLETQPDFRVIAIARDTNETRRCCHDSSKVDVILMDIELINGGSEENGLNLTRSIKEEFKEKFPKLKVIIFTMHDEPRYEQRAREVGAAGFIPKSGTSSEKLFKTIREIAERGGHEGSIEVEKGPTRTELEVLKYLAQGMQTAQVGVELAMLEATVSVHRGNIRQKFKINTPGELTLFAKDCMGIYGIPPDPKLSEELARHTREFKEQIKKRIGMEVEPANEVTVDVKFTDGIGEFNNATNRALSRTVEEALKNIRQHASACKVSIHLTELNASWITLAISDDGKGFDVAHISSGSSGGIGALRRILAAIGGELAINSSLGSGTTVTATLRRTVQR
jgi:DNA-binding NarL/FixJ family response regulator